MLRFRHVPLAAAILAITTSTAATAASEGPYVGLEVGAADPTNDNYRSHVGLGVSGAPFAGYMFNPYFGLQGQFHVTTHSADDNDDRPQANLDHRDAWTTMLGLTAGPRLSLPIGDAADIYILGQGGGFKGVSGRLNQWAPGFTVGGGVDFNVTENLAVGLFGRWNRAYMAPHPTSLVGHVDDDQGPKDARWVTAGVGIKYTFTDAPRPLPPPPPPPPAVVQAPPPPPPVKKVIVLRSINFDFDKAVLKPSAGPILDEAVEVLRDGNSSLVIVEGHTDSKGSDAYNHRLSLRRAGAVRDYLVRRGVDADRIKVEGRGESEPVASNDTAEGRAENRRVELHLN